MRFSLQRLMTLVVSAGLIASLGASCFAAEAAPGTPDVQVHKAWIRLLPASVPSGGYMTLTNTGSVPRVLLSATSPDFGEVSFHETRNRNGITEMAALSSVTVKPQSSVHFSPGGYHIMLFQPTISLHPGDHVPVTLRFIDGQTLAVQFEVRAAGASEPSRADDMENMPGMHH